MKIEVDIDEALLAQAEAISDMHDRSALVNDGLRFLLRYREAAQGLIALGGSDPNAWAPGWKEPDNLD